MLSQSHNNIENGGETPKDLVKESTAEKKKTVSDQMTLIENILDYLCTMIRKLEEEINLLKREVGDCRKDTRAIRTMFEDNQQKIVQPSPHILPSSTDDSEVNRQPVVQEENRQRLKKGSEMNNSSECPPKSTGTKKSSSSTKRTKNYTQEEPERKAKKWRSEAPEVEEKKSGKSEVGKCKAKEEIRKSMAERIEMPRKRMAENIKRNIEDRLQEILSKNEFEKLKNKKTLFDGVVNLYDEYRNNTNAIKSFMRHSIENQRDCVLCGKFHFSDTCEIVTKISARTEILERKKHCMICTKRHKGHCTATVFCNICSTAKMNNRLLLAGLDHPPMFCPLQEEYHRAMNVKDALSDAKMRLAEQKDNKKN